MTQEQFVGVVENWDNHRVFLFKALEALHGKKDLKVIELGMGKGSTQQLHSWCYDNYAYLESYDYSEEWANQYRDLDGLYHLIRHVTDWDIVDLKCDVLLIDHSPGERRRIDIARAANIAKIIVVHDTEPSADHGYQMRDALKTFKYLKDYETPGAWTTVVSNFIDVTEWSI